MLMNIFFLLSAVSSICLGSEVQNNTPPHNNPIQRIKPNKPYYIPCRAKLGDPIFWIPGPERVDLFDQLGGLVKPNDNLINFYKKKEPANKEPNIK